MRTIVNRAHFMFEFDLKRRYPPLTVKRSIKSMFEEGKSDQVDSRERERIFKKNQHILRIKYLLWLLERVSWCNQPSKAWSQCVNKIELGPWHYWLPQHRSRFPQKYLWVNSVASFLSKNFKCVTFISHSYMVMGPWSTMEAKILNLMSELESQKLRDSTEDPTKLFYRMWVARSCCGCRLLGLVLRVSWRRLRSRRWPQCVNILSVVHSQIQPWTSER